MKCVCETKYVCLDAEEEEKVGRKITSHKTCGNGVVAAAPGTILMTHSPGEAQKLNLVITKWMILEEVLA